MCAVLLTLAAHTRAQASNTRTSTLTLNHTCNNSVTVFDDGGNKGVQMTWMTWMSQMTWMTQMTQKTQMTQMTPAQLCNIRSIFF